MEKSTINRPEIGKNKSPSRHFSECHTVRMLTSLHHESLVRTMIRFFRALIYGAFAAIAASLILDWLDHRVGSPSKPDLVESPSDSNSAFDQMGDDAKKALLDELAAQV